mmetsp:Transcript_24743/g.30911  ORF Transcript_24743/g.30911 Transcript_24743/m.30911 type:complete len:131 (-) Transcript_24743:719-1111(-)
MQPIIRKLEDVVDASLNDASMDIEEISELVLVGGSSRIPHIKYWLQGKFPDAILNDRLNPAVSVAVGAAIQAAVLSGMVDQNSGVPVISTEKPARSITIPEQQNSSAGQNTEQEAVLELPWPSVPVQVVT